ncbi:MAG TPA: hypothetical protein PKK94_24480, partial [Leptospiraceae bacterium]|nr:hypothetical protein [Leptospiraceae bacterium]
MKNVFLRLAGISVLMAAVFSAVILFYSGREEKSAENKSLGTRLYSDGKFLETYLDIYKKKYGSLP